ncbi:MAG: sigma-70 family RNA polymerase sigma factor [Myxococcales bacterium]|nr:sigma-70 family RNA polymerase sigma factor [Myxococcales bacterium]MCB9716439.1 sigma-70 family RNA polymerase sigma factor [Myxococcales bacterium]
MEALRQIVETPRARASSAPPELSRALVEAACRREPVACRALIRRYQRPVASLLSRMLGPAGLGHLVEDLAQDTMVRAFGALPRFDPEGPAKLSTWILKIATRLAINELQRRRPPTEPIVTTEERLSGPHAADRDHRRATIARAIQDAVGQLSPEIRAAFLLREYHGLDYAEIARMLELEMGTVKSRLSRARASLRRALGEIHSLHPEHDDHG